MAKLVDIEFLSKDRPPYTKNIPLVMDMCYDSTLGREKKITNRAIMLENGQCVHYKLPEQVAAKLLASGNSYRVYDKNVEFAPMKDVIGLNIKIDETDELKAKNNSLTKKNQELERSFMSLKQNLGAKKGTDPLADAEGAVKTEIEHLTPEKVE